jgi:uncharacterized protein (TIGR00369 family)
MMTNMSNVLPELLSGKSAPVPVAELIGFAPTEISKGRAVFEFTAEHRHANPMGTLHGGIMCDVADAAMGMAYASTLEQGESFTTLDLRINYLRPFWTGHLVATAQIVKAGRTVGYVECDIADDEKRLIARASSTCMSLRGQEASGR